MWNSIVVQSSEWNKIEEDNFDLGHGLKLCQNLGQHNQFFKQNVCHQCKNNQPGLQQHILIWGKGTTYWDTYSISKRTILQYYIFEQYLAETNNLLQKHFKRLLNTLKPTKSASNGGYFDSDDNVMAI